jgi:hypothetical protein
MQGIRLIHVHVHVHDLITPQVQVTIYERDQKYNQQSGVKIMQKLCTPETVIGDNLTF